MDTWRIVTRGQLAALLASDAARGAVAGEALRDRLRQRCDVVSVWIDLWLVGRGQPVDRSVLEQCDAVSGDFIDRVATLAKRLEGDGAALVAALRARVEEEARGFRTNKADDLEQWLADEGYTDDRERLTADDRRRLTLLRVAPGTEAAARDVDGVIDCLESAVNWLEAATETGG